MRIDEVIQQPGLKERLVLEAFSKDMKVAIPGEIVSYDTNTRTATIQPVIRDWDSADDPPVLLDVPVFMWGNFTFEPQEGDGCLVVCADSCIDAWLQSGGVSSPSVARSHSLSDGFAFVGFRQTGGTDLPGKLNTLDEEIADIYQKKLDKQSDRGILYANASGSVPYCKLLTINITSTYVNRPIMIELSRRGGWFSHLQIRFKNANNTDPDLDTFISDSEDNFYIYRVSASKWEVYAAYYGSYGIVSVHRISGCGANIGITVTPDVTLQSLPTGAKKASFWYVRRLPEIQKKLFSELDEFGNTSLDGITSIPTNPGVYRVTSVIAGLPSGTNGYGPLLVINGGSYLGYYYIDARNDLYYARTASVTAPSKWYKVTSTEVGLTT